MSALEEIRDDRLKKKAALEAAGMASYPSDTGRTHTLGEVLGQFEALLKDDTHITVAGRVMVVRGQGAILFVDLKDGTGKLQAVFKEDEIDKDAFALFGQCIDNGDFIEVSGTVFVTQKGQQSLLVKEWRMLTKSLLPLPDKYHGLKDEDSRYRKRYLDLLLDDELRELFVRKQQFWRITRNFLSERGFLEVETPTLEVTTGGAEARPFKTHHNDFDIDVFLRISVGELWQKRLMAAGFDKTFEIGRVYRNEGTSPEHLQEFTNMEFYWAYANYEDGMALVKDLYTTLAKEIYGSTSFTHKGLTFDLADEWRKVDYVSEIKEQTGIDVVDASEEEMEAKLQELNATYEGGNKERLTDTLWKYCRKHIAGPAFLVNHPKAIAPLSKSRPENPDTTQKFQVLIAGSEVGTGYSELNDPLDQRARFLEQQRLLEEGDEEAMMMDETFVEMLEHGMPPTCGFGFGERLFAIFENKPIREAQLFPLMRPKDSK